MSQVVAAKADIILEKLIIFFSLYSLSRAVRAEPTCLILCE